MVNAEASPMSSLMLQLLSDSHIPATGAKPGNNVAIFSVRSYHKKGQNLQFFDNNYRMLIFKLIFTKLTKFTLEKNGSSSVILPSFKSDDRFHLIRPKMIVQ